jgi:hypothetical protein
MVLQAALLRRPPHCTAEFKVAALGGAAGLVRRTVHCERSSRRLCRLMLTAFSVVGELCWAMVEPHMQRVIALRSCVSVPLDKMVVIFLLRRCSYDLKGKVR